MINILSKCRCWLTPERHTSICQLTTVGLWLSMLVLNAGFACWCHCEI